MDYAITISGAPYSSQAPQTAYHFTQAALERGHRVTTLFLYGDGVHLASTLATPPRDEAHWGHRWRSLLAENGIRGLVCVASALRRGLVDKQEARRYELAGSNLERPWELAGLGDWVDLRLHAGRSLFFR